jgi:hypothetical protein
MAEKGGWYVKENRGISSTLFPLAFLIHLAWVIYVYASNNRRFAFIDDVRRLVSNAYSIVGFEWDEAGSYLVAAALISSFILNVLRRFLEGFLKGWPQFENHDRHSLARAFVRFVGYGLMVYFAAGFFGEKHSSAPFDWMDVGLIAASTYIFGIIVDIIDDVISGFYCVFLRNGYE